jgi:GNAT superfamily N-acetyltransferase
MRLYEAIKLTSREKNPNTKKFMDTLYKVTQVHPFDHSQRIAWDGKSTIELRPMGDHIHLVAIQTLAPGERSGSASGLVATAVEIAKETGVKIRLSPKPFGQPDARALDKRQLVAWYKRRGFKPSTQGEMEFDPALTEDYDQIGLEAPKGEGSITGYVVDTGAEQLENYFVLEHGVPERVIENIRHEYNLVAVLRNFSVEEDYRGQGHGTELFEDFMVEAIESGAEAVLLIADNGEELPFDLEEWYKGWGFDTIGQTSSGPFMVYRSAG